MKTKLISITPDAEKIISYCARVSSPNQENEEYAKLLKYCIKNKHWSIFEQAFMTVEVETSRAISAQILRHNSLKFQEWSQRYASVGQDGIEIYEARRQDNKNRQNSIDDLSDEIKEEWIKRQKDNWKQSYKDYEWALENGIAKECARMILPIQTKTKLYVSGSIRSFIHWLEVRTSNGTQKEHMDIANSVKGIFIKELPVISQALDWK